jgi:hypothetical protein
VRSVVADQPVDPGAPGLAEADEERGAGGSGGTVVDDEPGHDEPVGRGGAPGLGGVDLDATPRPGPEARRGVGAVSREHRRRRHPPGTPGRGREVGPLDDESGIDEAAESEAGRGGQRRQSGTLFEVVQQPADPVVVGQHHPGILDADLQVGVVTTEDSEAGTQDGAARQAPRHASHVATTAGVRGSLLHNAAAPPTVVGGAT